MGVERINKIENRSNEMVDQIKDLITKSYPPMLGYYADYFMGEGEDTERRMLVFDVSARAFGNLYRKAVHIRPPKTINDYENDFIGKILTDFILLGTTFLTNTVMASRISKHEDSDAILPHPFSKSRLKNVNLN
jgi:hypothetical protein